MDKKYINKRIREIVSVFVKHGFKSGLGNPKEVRLAFEELGPSFIKIGQLLSTRTDLIPIEYINELKKLQDDLEPQDFNIMKDVIENELDLSIDQVFDKFEKTPIATASIAQVYIAQLKTGEKVAIKVQSPLVKERMLSDIRILKKLELFANLTSTSQFIDFNKVIDELSDAVEKELNFSLERANIIKFANNNKDIKYVTVPKVYEKYSTEKILVMDYISGIKIDNIDQLKKEAYDLHDIAIKITYNYFKQVFEDGFFHADPHPGNILIHNNTIAYIDFGLMGTLSSDMMKKLNRLLEGIATKDIGQITNSVLAIGVQKGDIDKDKLYKDIEILYNTYIDQSIHDYDLHNLFNHIIQVIKNNNLGLPNNIGLLSKAILTLQSILAKIDEDITLTDIARPYFKNRIISIKLKEIDFTQLALFLYSSAKSGVQLPNKLLDLVESTKRGGLNLKFSFKEGDKTINNINKMVNRLIIAIVVVGLLVSSSLVINANVGLKIYGISSMGIFGYVSAAIAGLMLLISIFKSGKL